MNKRREELVKDLEIFNQRVEHYMDRIDTIVDGIDNDENVDEVEMLVRMEVMDFCNLVLTSFECSAKLYALKTLKDGIVNQGLKGFD